MNRGSSTFEANLKPDQVSGGLGAAAQARTQNQAVSARPTILAVKHLSTKL